MHWRQLSESWLREGKKHCLHFFLSYQSFSVFHKTNSTIVVIFVVCKWCHAERFKMCSPGIHSFTKRQRLNLFPNKPWFLRVCSKCLLKKKNTAGKGEIARNEQFLLFPQCFSICLETNFLPCSSNLKSSSANSFSLEKSKMCRLPKG